METSFSELCSLCATRQLNVRDDSRQVLNGDIFVAIHGASSDGDLFIEDAIRRGAGWIVCTHEIAGLPAGTDLVVVRHDDPREAIWRLAAARWNTAVLPMKIIGITGTNGKTTSAYLLEHLYRSIGMNPAVLGTVNYRWNGIARPAPLTTPGPLQMHAMLAEMAKDKVDIVIMEVSSHSLAQKRVGGISFDGALFTNLTQDHLDYHRDMEDYFRAKASLFVELPRKDKAMSINCDDRYGRRLLELLPGAISWGLHEGQPGQSHLLGRILKSGPAGLQMQMSWTGRKWLFETPLVGEFNAHNLLGCQALGLAMGLEPEQMRGLEDFGGVCGRLERIANENNLNIFVDYAHTPDALINVLQALRAAGFQRIITVFGCGGNRDRGKRPLMGKAVARYSDVAILTSDNPRFENPEQIIADVLPGLANAPKLYVEADRRRATEIGLNLLGPDDALLIAGKGHEDYQLVKGEKLHYSDQEVVRELLNCA